VKARHVSFRFRKNNVALNAIWYNAKDFVEAQKGLSNRSLVDVVFQPEIDTYFESPRINLKIEDMAFSSGEAVKPS